MGNLYYRTKQDGAKVYYADYWRDGKRHQVSLRTGNKAVATVKLRDLEMSTTSVGEKTTQSLTDAIGWYLETICAGSPEGTRDSYASKAAHLIRLMGDVDLDDLTSDRVRTYIATRLKEEAHTHSIYKELVVLRQSLKAAKERTPAMFHGDVATIVPKYDAKYEPRKTYLTPDQFQALGQHIVAPLPANASPEMVAASELRRQKRLLYCVLIAFASPRLGELHKMRWEANVDRHRQKVIVPKGKTVSREIKIAPTLGPWLELFGSNAGWRGPMVETWGSVCRDLASACARAGIPRVTPNDLRRTFASWLVQGGESLFVVSRLLGHNSTRMVERVYGQLSDEVLDAAMAKLPLVASPVAAVIEPTTIAVLEQA